MACKLCAYMYSCTRIIYFLANTLPKGQLADDQFRRLYALVEHEYKQGKSFDSILERFHMIYGTKAVDKETIKTWYDGLEADRRESTIQSAQPPASAAASSISRSVYTLASIRGTIKLSEVPHNFYFGDAASRSIDDRYLFLHATDESSCFYVMDTFNDDIQ